MLSFFKYQKLTLLWALFVLFMCGMHVNEQTAKASIFFPGFDKMVHCGFFLVFTTLCCHGIICKRGTLSILNAFSVIIIAVGFGAMIEILQRFVFTWRDADWGDLFADTIGVCMAVFVILMTSSATRYVKA